ncbi:MAG: AIPR family protein, partial [Pseudanabaena sp.]
SSYIQFRQHLEGLWNDLSNVEKGTRFAELVSKTLSTQEDFSGLKATSTQHSYDQGIDMYWTDIDTNKQKILCQSKYSIYQKDDFDGIISKFQAFESNASNTNKPEKKQLNLLSQVEDIPETDFHYYIATLSDLSLILQKYSQSNLASVSFYEKLKSSRRITVVDGEKLYQIFLSAYRKEVVLPQKIEFKSVGSIVSHENVHVGIMSASELVRIYKNSGEGIFFENVRDFIGLGKSDSLQINNEIFKTAKDKPQKMLERNNGITFKAKKLSIEEDHLIVLEQAGIINGCQTTACVFQANPQDNCFIVFKVVETEDEEDSLTIAKTANTQNKIEKINLELSEYIRPQILRIALVEAGMEAQDPNSPTVPSLASTIALKKVFKSDLRYLFIALFSNKPRNTFRSDYALIRFEELGKTCPTLEDKKKLVVLLARLLQISSQVLESLRTKETSEEAQNKVLKIFKRFFEEKTGYKAYITVVGICCFLGISSEEEYRKKDIGDLIDCISNALNNEEIKYQEVLAKAFKAVAVSATTKFSGKEKSLDDELSQGLHSFMQDKSFDTFYSTYGIMSL